MSNDDTHVPLHGTQPIRQVGAVSETGKPAEPAEWIELDILVKSRGSVEELAFDVQAMSERLPAEREYIDHEEFEKRFGADPECIDRMKAFADRWNLEIVRINTESRLFVVRGTAAALERAFRIEFVALRFAGKRHRSIDGLVHVPRELHDVVEAVFGLDNVPMWDRTTIALDSPDAGASQPAESAADTGYVERFYQFPESTSGRGQTIGLIMLAGGYFPDDLDNYFSRAGLKTPDIQHVLLGGGKNDPMDRDVMRAWIEESGYVPRDPSRPPIDWAALGDPHAVMSHIIWTIEATLDLQLLGTFANDAKIVVYFAPNDERGKINALATALGDTVHRPSVISCSWGKVEDGVNRSTIRSIDRLLQSAALKGVTVCYSSGDRGADVDGSKHPHVHFPASSPHVLSCGGTTLNTHRRAAEVVWNERAMQMHLASGGGFSRYFAMPPWQTRAVAEFDARYEQRGVPDVAAKADMADGYPIVVAGHTLPMGGTSAAAPMWAALVARLNESLGRRVGWLTPLLYRDEFRRTIQPISVGTDGFFEAKPGWDPCTGCGTPRGRGLVEALRGE